MSKKSVELENEKDPKNREKLSLEIGKLQKENQAAFKKHQELKSKDIQSKAK